MQVAITEWEGRVSPVFDTASRVVLLQIEGSREAGRHEAQFVGLPPTQRVQHLLDLEIEVLICGAISRRMPGCCGQRLRARRRRRGGM